MSEWVIKTVGGMEICRYEAETFKQAVEMAVREGKHLSRAVLSRANLSRAVLSGADLSGANLSRANLSRAVLSRANLSRAVLSGADLSGANLFGADLSGAVLSRAVLSRADLSRADLSGAVLSRAVLSRADLFGADLSGAKIAVHIVSRTVARATRSDGYECVAFQCDGGVLLRFGCRTVLGTDTYRAWVASQYPGTDKAAETLLILDYIDAQAKRLGAA